MRQIEERIRRELPSLSDEQAEELAELVCQLATKLAPERVYVFGSRARNDARPDSDVDLLVVVPESDEPGYRRDQEARRLLRRRFLFPLDILIVTRDEFGVGDEARSSLAATVLREGKQVYAA
jgi:predicted nucleotidyltransferase